MNTKAGYETDFFARHNLAGDVNLIQVCRRMGDQKTFEREIRGLKSAMNELPMPSGTIVTWDDEAMPENGIEVVPAWKWLLT